ncbi:hypothetical protein IE53DRAFT_90182 [Violaceomyces palustris]|uniref:Uncharacterized protein n=1 Tax=Violaceomyces palustris TaxID=1673888 RepID=A0ACD0P733_9BASI|nr:hypothetical protein IE53DRAFT_90182 [Violaceomyces palustris]
MQAGQLPAPLPPSSPDPKKKKKKKKAWSLCAPQLTTASLDNPFPPLPPFSESLSSLLIHSSTSSVRGHRPNGDETRIASSLPLQGSGATPVMSSLEGWGGESETMCCQQGGGRRKGKGGSIESSF